MESWVGPWNKGTAAQLGLKTYADNFWPPVLLTPPVDHNLGYGVLLCQVFGLWNVH